MVMRLLCVLVSLDRRSCALDTGDLDQLRPFMIVHYVLSLPEQQKLLPPKSRSSYRTTQVLVLRGSGISAAIEFNRPTSPARYLPLLSTVSRNVYRYRSACSRAGRIVPQFPLLLQCEALDKTAALVRDARRCIREFPPCFCRWISGTLRILL